MNHYNKNDSEVNFDFILDDGRKVNVNAYVECSNYNKYADKDEFPYDIGDTTIDMTYFKDLLDITGTQLFKHDISASDWTKLLAKAEEQCVSDYFLNLEDSHL